MYGGRRYRASWSKLEKRYSILMYIIMNEYYGRDKRLGAGF